MVKVKQALAMKIEKPRSFGSPIIICTPLLYCIFGVPLSTYLPKSLSKQYYMIGITFSKASAQIDNILKMQLYLINVNICSIFFRFGDIVLFF
jgi:hypothetical protein